MSMTLFDISCIEASLRAFQSDFGRINPRLSLHREPFTDDLLANMLSAYAFLNEALAKGFHIMTPAGQHALLEMNHLVLCGTEPKTRFEYHNHVLKTMPSRLPPRYTAWRSASRNCSSKGTTARGICWSTSC